MLSVPVRSETAREVETRFAARNEIEDPGTGDCAQHLGNHVRNELARREASSGPQPQGHGGVEVTPGNVTDCVRHGQDCQTKSKGDPDESDAERRKGGGQYRTAAAAQNQPERAYEFGRETFAELHESA